MAPLALDHAALLQYTTTVEGTQGLFMPLRGRDTILTWFEYKARLRVRNWEINLTWRLQRMTIYRIQPYRNSKRKGKNQTNHVGNNATFSGEAAAPPPPKKPRQHWGELRELSTANTNYGAGSRSKKGNAVSPNPHCSSLHLSLILNQHSENDPTKVGSACDYVLTPYNFDEEAPAQSHSQATGPESFVRSSGNPATPVIKYRTPSSPVFPQAGLAADPMGLDAAQSLSSPPVALPPVPNSFAAALMPVYRTILCVPPMSIEDHLERFRVAHGILFEVNDLLAHYSNIQFTLSIRDGGWSGRPLSVISAPQRSPIAEKKGPVVHSDRWSMRAVFLACVVLWVLPVPARMFKWDYLASTAVETGCEISRRAKRVCDRREQAPEYRKYATLTNTTPAQPTHLPYPPNPYDPLFLTPLLFRLHSFTLSTRSSHEMSSREVVKSFMARVTLAYSSSSLKYYLSSMGKSLESFEERAMSSPNWPLMGNKPEAHDNGYEISYFMELCFLKLRYITHRQRKIHNELSFSLLDGKKGSKCTTPRH
ncbi:uncharacterized protein BDR25DRAFT_349558 [Lindgomyces ingoldianus]|uniref:Uncharacterized protein n=1 Tax=Lindgomyces ingoldianus TaxID=673940 RepID=A0ACB6RCL6_9PLEO|nr:uncharacterized protein BDR25DRAFT_349558 [Lindgomyces ingoldianus]KAF2476470.1 hypothetical protein BDR25DRAFT_349558 [Lindgomyces ingoldianus]